MKQTINLSDFRSAFHNAGRSTQFSYEALAVIFDYYEEYEQDSGEEIELDVVAICCDLTEDDVEGIAESYDIDLYEDSENPTDEEKRDTVLCYLDYHSRVIGTTDTSIIYVNF